MMKKLNWFDRIVMGVLAVSFVYAGVATQTKKEARGLEFHATEYPHGVWFDWNNARETQTHSIYRRLSGTADVWERIAMGLTGKTGGTLYDGFTLDQTWDYEFREDAEE